jgi:acyl carrier protein
LLDRHGHEVPVGVAGEIFVAGAGVARGYLNRAELTAQRFVADPYSEMANARMYRSGDLARWREDGSLEYLGRNDHQVKIRGFRIELGEIENALLRYPRVKDALVVVREDSPGEKRLVAYVVSRAAEGLSLEEIRAVLRESLPEYMVPSAFVTLESFPLTPSGKLDRRALPPPQFEAYTSRDYEEPQGDMEEQLAQIWQKLLGIARVGRDDNFFELGGHSLLATQVAVRLESALSIAVPVRILFSFPTLRMLAAQVDQMRRARLNAEVAARSEEIEDLLERVASMPESQVRELMQELRTEGRL